MSNILDTDFDALDCVVVYDCGRCVYSGEIANMPTKIKSFAGSNCDWYTLDPSCEGGAVAIFVG